MLPSFVPASAFLGFVFFSTLPLPAATAPFTPFYSSATQCGPFTVTWGASNVTTGPPFFLLILPLDAPPTIVSLPDSAFDPTTKTGKYTLDRLPLKSAAQFIVTMDDGYGRGTGGVSLIQTVGDSADASCLTADVSAMSSFFTFDPATPSQCSPQTVSWNSTRYREPPDIRGFIPGGQPFTLDRPASNSSTQQIWDVHIREGTQFIFLVQPAASNQNTTGNSDARTSPLITVTGKSSQGDACLDTGSPSSTVVSPAIGSILTVPGSTDPSRNLKVAAITGGIIGGLGLIAIICASIVLYRSLKRKKRIHSSKKGGLGGPDSNQLRPRAFNGFVSTTGERSLAGITIASTQVSGGTRTISIGRQKNMMNEFGASLRDNNGTRENSSAYLVPPGTNMQGRTGYPPPPSRPFRRLPLPPPPIISVTEDALSDRWGDEVASIAYEVPIVDEKRTGLGDVLTESHSDPRRDEHDLNPGREPEQYAWSAHPYANPLAAVNHAPHAPMPDQRGSVWSPSPPHAPMPGQRGSVWSPPPPPPSGIGVWGGDRDGDDNRDGDGDQAVNEEYAFGSRRGLSLRARMDRAGNVYGGSRGGNRSRENGNEEENENENEITTEYVRHTGAGTVRDVELPPSYHDLQR